MREVAIDIVRDGVDGYSVRIRQEQWKLDENSQPVVICVEKELVLSANTVHIGIEKGIADPLNLDNPVSVGRWGRCQRS